MQMPSKPRWKLSPTREKPNRSFLDSNQYLFWFIFSAFWTNSRQARLFWFLDVWFSFVFLGIDLDGWIKQQECERIGNGNEKELEIKKHSFRCAELSKWWSLSESNQRHKDFQSFALPTELRDHMVAGEGFEPTTSGLWARRATRLLYPAMCLIILTDSDSKCKQKFLFFSDWFESAFWCLDQKALKSASALTLRYNNRTLRKGKPKYKIFWKKFLFDIPAAQWDKKPGRTGWIETLSGMLASLSGNENRSDAGSCLEHCWKHEITSWFCHPPANDEEAAAEVIEKFFLTDAAWNSNVQIPSIPDIQIDRPIKQTGFFNSVSWLLSFRGPDLFNSGGTDSVGQIGSIWQQRDGSLWNPVNVRTDKKAEASIKWKLPLFWFQSGRLWKLTSYNQRSESSWLNQKLEMPRTTSQDLLPGREMIP